MKFGRGVLWAITAFAIQFAIPPALAQFAFEKHDRVALIGNALPDRMQHDGWLEAYLQAANPDKKLVMRTLAFSGDEVVRRPREEGYPSPDELLTLVRANVIFAFFGYNESYCHDPEMFKNDLRNFIENETIRRQSGPAIVLFSSRTKT